MPSERTKIVKLLGYAYAAHLRTYRSKPYPIEPEEYRRAIHLRTFLDDQLGGSAYRFVHDKGWDFKRFCQAVSREAHTYNCGPVQSWERR